MKKIPQTKKQETLRIIKEIFDYNKIIIIESKLCSDRYLEHFLEHKTLLNHLLLQDQKSSIQNVQYSAILLHKKMEELTNHLFNLEVIEPND